MWQSLPPELDSLVLEFARGAEKAPTQVPLLAVLRVLALSVVPRAVQQSPQYLMPPFGRSWENPNVARGEASPWMGASVH